MTAFTKTLDDPTAVVGLDLAVIDVVRSVAAENMGITDTGKSLVINTTVNDFVLDPTQSDSFTTVKANGALTVTPPPTDPVGLTDANIKLIVGYLVGEVPVFSDSIRIKVDKPFTDPAVGQDSVVFTFLKVVTDLVLGIPGDAPVFGGTVTPTFFIQNEPPFLIESIAKSLSKVFTDSFIAEDRILFGASALIFDDPNLFTDSISIAYEKFFYEEFCVYEDTYNAVLNPGSTNFVFSKDEEVALTDLVILSRNIVFTDDEGLKDPFIAIPSNRTRLVINLVVGG